MAKGDSTGQGTTPNTGMSGGGMNNMMRGMGSQMGGGQQNPVYQNNQQGGIGYQGGGQWSSQRQMPRMGGMRVMPGNFQDMVSNTQGQATKTGSTGPGPNQTGPSLRRDFGNMQHFGGTMDAFDPNNQLLQGMDPRLVSLFQKYNTNPSGAGTGTSDIAYWNNKLNLPDTDPAYGDNYYLNRAEQDFLGTGQDASGVDTTGQDAQQRQYQQPMQRSFGRVGGPRGRFGFGGSQVR